MSVRYVALSFLVFAIFCSSCSGQPVNSRSEQPAAAKGDTVRNILAGALYVFQAKDGSYWFGSDGEGVYHLKDKVMIRYATQHGLCNDRVRGIQEDKSGNIYINTLDGISRYDGHFFTTLHPVISKADKGWRLNADDLWFAGRQGTAAVYRYDGTTLYELKIPQTKEGEDFIAAFPYVDRGHLPYTPYDVYTIYKDKRGDIWLGTGALGLCRYNGKDFCWMYEKHLSEIEGGGSFGIRSILEDRNGQFWICNTKYRYSILPGSTIKDTGVYVNYTRQNGIEHFKGANGKNMTYFMSVVGDSTGALWMVTYNEGVYKYDGHTVTNYHIKDGTENVTLFSIYKDRSGTLLLGTHKHGVYMWDGSGFRKFTF